MNKKDKRIDAYITASADFAQPILNHLRQLIHKACPETEETIKWGFPHFQYKNEILCSMASFKQHCAFMFWKSSLLKDPSKILTAVGESGMGNLGKLKSLKDLPSDKILMAYLKEAAMLNDAGIKRTVTKAPIEKKELVTPEYLKKALSKNKLAKETFEAFSYSHKKEYIEWITEAKTDETRNKRIARTMEWLEGGKSRNWKYKK